MLKQLQKHNALRLQLEPSQFCASETWHNGLNRYSKMLSKLASKNIRRAASHFFFSQMSLLSAGGKMKFSTYRKWNAGIIRGFISVLWTH